MPGTSHRRHGLSAQLLARPVWRIGVVGALDDQERSRRRTGAYMTL